MAYLAVDLGAHVLESRIGRREDDERVELLQFERRDTVVEKSLV